jgi:hypothetical protein
MTTRFACTALALTLSLGLPLHLAAAAPDPTRAGPAIGDSLPFEAAVFLGCDKLPAGDQAVRLDLPAEPAVADVLDFMARVSCSPVHLGAGVSGETKVKIAGRRLVSAQAAFSIVDAAITGAGLSLQAEKSAPNQFQLVVKRRAD